MTVFQNKTNFSCMCSAGRLLIDTLNYCFLKMEMLSKIKCSLASNPLHVRLVRIHLIFHSWKTHFKLAEHKEIY